MFKNIEHNLEPGETPGHSEDFLIQCHLLMLNKSKTWRVLYMSLNKCMKFQICTFNSLWNSVVYSLWNIAVYGRRRCCRRQRRVHGNRSPGLCPGQLKWESVCPIVCPWQDRLRIATKPNNIKWKMFITYLAHLAQSAKVSFWDIFWDVPMPVDRRCEPSTIYLNTSFLKLLSLQL